MNKPLASSSIWTRTCLSVCSYYFIKVQLFFSLFRDDEDDEDEEEESPVKVSSTPGACCKNKYWALNRLTANLTVTGQTNTVQTESTCSERQEFQTQHPRQETGNRREPTRGNCNYTHTYTVMPNAIQY